MSKIYRILELIDNPTHENERHIDYVGAENEVDAEAKARKAYPKMGGYLKVVEVDKQLIRDRITKLDRELYSLKTLLSWNS